MTHMIRIQDARLTIRSMVDQGSLVKDSLIGMPQQLPGTQSTRDFIMKVNDDITESQSSLAVLIESCCINKRGLHE